MTDTIQRHYDSLSDANKALFDTEAAQYERVYGMPRYMAERRAHRFICRIKRIEREGGR